MSAHSVGSVVTNARSMNRYSLLSGTWANMAGSCCSPQKTSQVSATELDRRRPALCLRRRGCSGLSSQVWQLPGSAGPILGRALPLVERSSVAMLKFLKRWARGPAFSFCDGFCNLHS